jgi:nitronate monooxygenase
MQWLGEPHLAAAVSNAGGLGTINVTCYKGLDDFKYALKLMNELTDKPYCVNITMLPSVSRSEENIQFIKAAAEAGCKVIETAGNNPEPYVGLIKELGMIHLHKVPTVRHALTAQRLGVDAVTIVGIEAGGHPGADEICGNILINKASSVLDIPILMAGSVADGRSLVSALALGADGVVMATRFVASKECWVSDNHKQWIVNANENDTVIVQKSIKNPVRAANNLQAKKCLDAEAKGATLEELMTIIAGKFGKVSYENGNVDGSIFPVGNSVCLVHDILSCEEIINNIIQEAEETLRRLNLFMS